jgi:hypothetical protein
MKCLAGQTEAVLFMPFAQIKTDGNLVLLEIIANQLNLQATWL